MIDQHQEDRSFLQNVKLMTDGELLVYRQWQAQEEWRRIVIEREMDRRKEGTDETGRS